jgi:hypothetical protein
MNTQENGSLESQYAALLERVAAENKLEGHPFPSGFWKSYGAFSKQRQGFGFYCPKCKLSVAGNAPEKVKHCGTVSAQPTGLFAWFKRLRLPRHRIAARLY